MGRGVRLIGGEASWRGPDVAGETDWVWALEREEQAEIARAAAACGDRADVASVYWADFPLPTIYLKIRQMERQVAAGRGFAVMRGIPVNGQVPSHAKRIFHGLCAHFRATEPRNATMVLCARNTPSIGMSRLVSSVAIHDHIALTRPDLLQVLYEPFPMTVGRREVDEAAAVPVFTVREGELASCCDLARSGGRRLTKIQTDALDLFRTLASHSEFCVDIQLSPGDLQVIAEGVILHSMAGFAAGDIMIETRRRS